MTVAVLTVNILPVYQQEMWQSDSAIVYHFAENVGLTDYIVGDDRNSIHFYKFNYPLPRANYFSIHQCFSFPLFYYTAFFLPFVLLIKLFIHSIHDEKDQICIDANKGK